MTMSEAFNKRYGLFAMGILLLAGVLAYSNTFQSPFHFDDTRTIVNNRSIKNILDLKAVWNPWPTRFVTFLSLALNYRLGGLNVSGYHILNILVHVLSAIMVWWLMLLTFFTPVMKDEKITMHARVIALFGGLIFVTHPVQTQAVTYIIQRSASLATLFYLASLAMYVKSKLLLRQGAAGRSKWLYRCSLTAAVLAMFSKEMTITLPLAVILYEFCFFRTDKRFDWKYAAPMLYTVLIIPVTMLLTGSVDVGGMHRVLESKTSITAWQYLLTQFRVILTYIRLLLMPVNQNLDYYYAISRSLAEPALLASMAVLAAILATAVKIFSKYRLVSFGIFWFFLTLLPESSFIPIKDVIFEHRLYLPMAGFCFFLAGGLYYVFGERSLPSAVTISLVIVICCTALSYQRNLVWKSEFTLWNDVVRKSPMKARPYNNRGCIYREKGRIAEAIADFDRAIKRNPRLAPIYRNRGLAYRRQGKLQQAIADYTKAIEIKPGYASAYYERAAIYLIMKDYDKAWADVKKAISLGIKPGQAFIENLEKASGKRE
jgi:tetratricopeptide (TPR) repeat protein